MYVPCAPGDAGCALGAALYADRIFFKQPHKRNSRPPLLGPGSRAPTSSSAVAREDGLPLETTRPAKTKSSGKQRTCCSGPKNRGLDGWCRVSSVRARSAIAAFSRRRIQRGDERPAQQRDKIPRRISALRTRSADRSSPRKYFDLPPGGAKLGNFMSGVFPVRDEWREQLGAITHVDGTARVQTVDARKSAAVLCAPRKISDGAAAFPFCSIRRSIWRASRSSLAPSKAIPRFGGAASTSSSPATSSSPKNPRTPSCARTAPSTRLQHK